METMNYSGVLALRTCPECSVVYALPEGFIEQRREDHKTWWCPNGHARHFPPPKVSEEDRLRAQLDQAQADADFQRRRRQEAEQNAEHQAARARGYKGAMVKAKQRSAKGVCPVPGCRRHFADVERHMRSKHPDFVDGQEHDHAG